jgi:hypothetical protein
VLQSPRAVFVALRDESEQSLSDRSEPVLLLVWLAGMAGALATTTTATLMNNGGLDGLDIAIWAFIAGGLSGATIYFVVGLILWRVVVALGSQGTYRRTRHVLAFAAAPVALSLVLWPAKLYIYGEDLFRTGGSDHGAGITLFGVLELGFLLWFLALLVIGIRAVHGWTWARAGAAAAITAVPVIALFALTSA